jgi:ABC-2 type transport system ATP-binding protein
VRLHTSVSGLPAIVRTVDAAGLELASLEIQAPTLDDVFLAKTGRSLEGAADDAADVAEPVEA